LTQLLFIVKSRWTDEAWQEARKMAENEKLDLFWRNSRRWLRPVGQFLAGEHDGAQGDLIRALHQTIKNVGNDLQTNLGISIRDLLATASTDPASARRLLNGFSRHRDYTDLMILVAKDRSPLDAARAIGELIVDRFLHMGIVDQRIERTMTMQEAANVKKSLLQRMGPQFDSFARSLEAGSVPRLPRESHEEKTVRRAALLKQSVLRRTRPGKEDRSAGESAVC